MPVTIFVFYDCHDDVIKWNFWTYASNNLCFLWLSWWRHQMEFFPRYWPFVRGIHRSPVNSPHKGQWRRALFSLICTWINGWVNNREAGDLRRHRTHYDVIVMIVATNSWKRPQLYMAELPPTSSTHLPLDKMAAISQTIFSGAFSWMKSFVFWCKFHWILFLRVQCTISQHWSR